MERFIEISNPTLFKKYFKIASTGPKCCAVNKPRTIDKTKEQKLKHIIHKVKKPYIFFKVKYVQTYIYLECLRQQIEFVPPF